MTRRNAHGAASTTMMNGKMLKKNGKFSLKGNGMSGEKNGYAEAMKIGLDMIYDAMLDPNLNRMRRLNTEDPRNDEYADIYELRNIDRRTVEGYACGHLHKDVLAEALRRYQDRGRGVDELGVCPHVGGDADMILADILNDIFNAAQKAAGYRIVDAERKG
jgi:hypothetical protein